LRFRKNKATKRTPESRHTETRMMAATRRLMHGAQRQTWEEEE
jgi:hypothetical protein